MSDAEELKYGVGLCLSLEDQNPISSYALASFMLSGKMLKGTFFKIINWKVPFYATSMSVCDDVPEAGS